MKLTSGGEWRFGVPKYGVGMELLFPQDVWCFQNKLEIGFILGVLLLQ